MDRQEVIEKNLVERYLRGELDEKTRQAFEIHYLEHPETLEELRLVEAMREGMVALEAKSKVTTMRSVVAAKPPLIPYAAAASMGLLALIMSGLYWQERRVDVIEAEPGYTVRMSLQRSIESENIQKAYAQRESLRFRQFRFIEHPMASITFDPVLLSNVESLYQFSLSRVDSSGGLSPVVEKDSISLPTKLRVLMQEMPPGFYQYTFSSIDGQNELVGYINLSP